MQEAIFHGVTSTPIAISEARRNESKTGWDSLKVRYLLDTGGNLAGALEDHFPNGQTHPGAPQMFVHKVDTEDQGGGVYALDVEWKGLLRGRGYQTKAEIFGESSTGQNIVLDLEGYPNFAPRIKIEQPVISFEVTYFQTGRPSLQRAKKAIDPTLDLPSDYPGFPTPPAQIWSSITDPTYVYPSGWVLDDREPEQLDQTVLYKVTDRFVFRYPTEM